MGHGEGSARSRPRNRGPRQAQRDNSVRGDLGVPGGRNRDDPPPRQRPGGRVDELLGAIESVHLLLDLLGPPIFGTRLLAHWASRDGTVKISEEELMAELRNVSGDEWEQAVVEAERDLSKPRMGPEDEEA